MSDFKSTPLIKFDQRKMQQTKESRYWRKFEQVFEKKYDDNLSFIRVNDKRKLFCFGINQSAVFYSFKEKKVIYDYRKEKEKILNLAIREDGLLSVFSNKSGYVKLINLKHQNLLKYFKFSNKPIYAVDIAHQKPLITAGDDEGNFKVFDFASEMDILTIPRLHTDFLRKIKFFPNDYQKLLTASFDKVSNLIDIREKKATLTINNESEIEDLCFIDDHRVSFACGKFLKIWDLRKTDQPIKNMFVANRSITSVSYVANRLITTSHDNHLKIFSEEENFKIVNQIKYDEPILAFGVDKNLCNYSIAFNNRKYQVFRKNQDKEEKVVNVRAKFSAFEKDLMYKLHQGVGRRDQNSYKFYNRGLYEKPEDFTIKINKPAKVNRNVYDQHLKKFQYSQAFEKVLQTNNTVVIISLIEELLIRQGLAHALKNMSGSSFVKLLQFLLKKIDSTNTLNIILEVYNEILNTCFGRFDDNETYGLLKKLQEAVNKENKMAQESGLILEMIDCL